MLPVLRRFAIAAGLAGSLAACQTAGTPLTDTARISLAQAGFQQVDVPPNVPVPGNIGIDGVFVCPKNRCGSPVVVMMATIASSDQSAVTMEELIQTGAVDGNTLRKVMQLGVSRTGTGSGTITSVTVGRSPATMTMRGRGQATMGKPAPHMTGIFYIKGNAGRGIMAISDTQAKANRYARPNWMN